MISTFLWRISKAFCSRTRERTYEVLDDLDDKDDAGPLPREHHEALSLAFQEGNGSMGLFVSLNIAFFLLSITLFLLSLRPMSPYCDEKFEEQSKNYMLKRVSMSCKCSRF